jgi:hypothetical protein
MDRRTFLATALSLTGVSRGTVLEAVFGAHLPATLRIAGLPARPWFELRAYRCSSPARLAQLDRLFMESGLFPGARMESGKNLKYLIPFDSLEDRNRSWTLFDSGPEWSALRSEGEPVRVSEITIYRPVYPGGRIFERSL